MIKLIGSTLHTNKWFSILDSICQYSPEVVNTSYRTSKSVSTANKFLSSLLLVRSNRRIDLQKTTSFSFGCVPFAFSIQCVRSIQCSTSTKQVSETRTVLRSMVACFFVMLASMPHISCRATEQTP